MLLASLEGRRSARRALGPLHLKPELLRYVSNNGALEIAIGDT
jgi:hypothetical protein